MDFASCRLPRLRPRVLFLDPSYRYVIRGTQPLAIPGKRDSVFRLRRAQPEQSSIGSPVLIANALLSTASGLYYLSELVEEHTVIAKRLLTRLIYFIIGLQSVLWLVDGLPLLLTLLGVISHVVYLGNMQRFPFVRLTDPLFLASCGTSTIHNSCILLLK